MTCTHIYADTLQPCEVLIHCYRSAHDLNEYTFLKQKDRQKAQFVNMARWYMSGSKLQSVLVQKRYMNNLQTRRNLEHV